MEINLTGPKWAARCDAHKLSGDYTEQLRVIASYYELYDRGYKLMGPWINRSRDAEMPVPPDKDTIVNALGKQRSSIHSIAHKSFVDSLYKFACDSKGKRQLINPDPATHHSAQFPSGTFTINQVGDVHHVNLYSCSEPLIVSGLKLPADAVNFIIVRPKLGKLGTPSIKNWEILFFKNHLSYLIDHTDSTLNPRWAGVM